jgi:hypothetical protein
MWLPIAHAQKECQLDSCGLLVGNEAVLVEGFADFAPQIAPGIGLLEHWQFLLPRLPEQIDISAVTSGKGGGEVWACLTDASVSLRPAELMNFTKSALGNREGVNCEAARAGSHCAAGGCGGWFAKYWLIPAVSCSIPALTLPFIASTTAATFLPLTGSSWE